MVIVVTLVALGDLLSMTYGLAGILATELLLVLMPVALYVRAEDLDWKRTLRLRPVGVGALLSAVVLGAGLVLVATEILRVQLQLAPLSDDQVAAWAEFAARIAHAPVLSILALAAAPAVAEEALFRGLLLSRFEARWGGSRALVASAALFALFHRDPQRLLAQGLLGLTLGGVVLATGTLWPAVVLHFAYNLGVLAIGAALLEGAGEAGQQVAAVILLGSGVAAFRLAARRQNVS